MLGLTVSRIREAGIDTSILEYLPEEEIVE